MIKRILILTIVVAATMLMCRCKKTSEPSIVYKGVVLYNVCGNVVIQSVEPDNLGENDWTDSNSPVNAVYDHVFKVSNACEFGNYSQGDTIRFTIVDPRPQQCAQCLLYVATPDAAYPIRVIK